MGAICADAAGMCANGRTNESALASNNIYIAFGWGGRYGPGSVTGTDNTEISHIHNMMRHGVKPI